MKTPHRLAVATATAALVGAALTLSLGLTGAVVDLVSRSAAADDIGATGKSQQVIAEPDGAWVYGGAARWTPAAESSGAPITVVSHTPEVCAVPDGNPAVVLFEKMNPESIAPP